MSTTARRQRWRRTNARHVAAALALSGAHAACAATDDASSSREATLLADATLERVTVTAARPATLPTEIPTTIESITGKQVERTINATDAEDALKYFPSLSVRKRYIGDYDHAVLATRASGTGNSARSLVYADGILLSNLLGNGAAFTPRWALVTPEEIERVDVLYGPFSAAYSGNSAGAIVDFVTRMPNELEAHAKLQGFAQNFHLYSTDERFPGGEGSASIGSRSGAFAWWINVNHLVSDAQPVSFVVKNLATTTSSTATPVTGAILDRNPKEVPGYVLGTTTQTHTVQDHAKLKLAYDLAPTVRASYTLGYWHNDADRAVDSYLRDGAGNTVTSGATAQTVAIDGRSYSVLPTDFARSQTAMAHLIQGLGVKSHMLGAWDWEAAASRYDYLRDIVRTQMPNAGAAAAGRISDQHGTGWSTLALKGIWRPQGVGGEHIAEFGVARDAFKLQTLVSDTPEWQGGDAAAQVSAFNGRTSLASLWAQDAWRFAPAWKTVLGARLERWQARDGSISDATTTRSFAPRKESYFSPKAALSWQASDPWLLQASLGRAVRMPTVSELFQGSLSATEIVNNDPNLKPEKSWTTELSAQRELGGAGSARATLFFERTDDALYSQVDTSVGGTVATVQNVDRIRTAGVELAGQGYDVLVKGLDLGASVTYADSTIVANDKFPASVGKQQPRVPRWRAALLASYAPDERWSASVGVRYSGQQYGQLDNSDSNGYAYTGFSKLFVVDLRGQYRLSRSWRVSAGIDNVNDDRYWAFHPYPQRTFHAELRFDL
jgi:iron complex outermembrane receptor protein